MRSENGGEPICQMGKEFTAATRFPVKGPEPEGTVESAFDWARQLSPQLRTRMMIQHAWILVRMSRFVLLYRHEKKAAPHVTSYGFAIIPISVPDNTLLQAPQEIKR